MSFPRIRSSACADVALPPLRGTDTDAFGAAEEVSSLKGLPAIFDFDCGEP